MFKNKNTSLAASLFMLLFGMCLLTYSARVIYNVFCKITGTGGTVQEMRQTVDHLAIGTKDIKIKFDSNIASNLPWEFKSLQNNITVKTGENALVFYLARNTTNDDIIGTATYNVTPHKAAKYFFKIECFCFQQQLLKAQEEVLMPVSFYIDPDIEKDPNLKEINTITLSYSFFKVSKENNNV